MSEAEATELPGGRAPLQPPAPHSLCSVAISRPVPEGLWTPVARLLDGITECDTLALISHTWPETGSLQEKVLVSGQASVSCRGQGLLATARQQSPEASFL